MNQEGCFRTVLHLQVDGCLVRETQSAEHLHGLMVLHDLHGTDVIVSDAVCRDAVFPAQEVVALDVELIDVYALVLYFPIVGHIDAGHTFQHVAYAPVLLLGKAAHIIGYRVPALPDTVGLDDYFLQLESPFFHPYYERIAIKRQRGGIGTVSHYGDMDGKLLTCRGRHDGEPSVGVTHSVSQQLPFNVFQKDIGPRYRGLVGRLDDGAGDRGTRKAVQADGQGH